MLMIGIAVAGFFGFLYGTLFRPDADYIALRRVLREETDRANRNYDEARHWEQGFLARGKQLDKLQATKFATAEVIPAAPICCSCGGMKLEAVENE